MPHISIVETLFRHFAELIELDITDTDSDDYKIIKQAFLAGSGATAASMESIVPDIDENNEVIEILREIQYQVIQFNPE